MATYYVDFCMTTKLPCANAQTQEVVLCLQDSALVVSTACPLPSEATYPGAYAEAEICQAYNNGDCGRTVWYYTFSYDSEILADSTVPLQPSDIVGVFCRDCLTSYFDYKIGDEVYVRTNEDDTQTLVTQHGCEYDIDIDVTAGVTDVTATLPITSSGGSTPDISTSMGTGFLIGRGSPGTGVMEEITIGSNLVLLGNTLNATGGGGGGCLLEVTTAAFNALLSGGTLTLGCFYTINDHSQNRIPAGTRVTVLATDVDAVSSECGVLTSYDTRPWRGVYDTATNTLVELADNQGNVCTQYPDGLFTFTCVDDFDWGNPGLTNCKVQSSTLIVTYGALSGVDNLVITGNSTVNLTSYTGNSLINIEVSNGSALDLTGSDVPMESVTIKNGSGVDIFSVGSTVNPFIFNCNIDYGFVTVPATGSLYMEGVHLSDLSEIQVSASSRLTVDYCDITGRSIVRTTGASTFGSSSHGCFVLYTTVHDQGLISFVSVASQYAEVQNSSIASSGNLTIGAITLISLSVTECTVDTQGLLAITDGSSTCDNISVSQGILNSGGFQMIGVYVKGVLTHTCVGNENNTGYTNITGGTITGITDLAIADGGTGASTAPAARTNLGIGTIGTQNANAVAITGGTITGITDLAIADGGTGQSTPLLGFNALAAGLVWTDYAGSISVTVPGPAIIGGISIVRAWWVAVGRIAFVEVAFTATLSGATTNVVNVSLPTPAATIDGVFAAVLTNAGFGIATGSGVIITTTSNVQVTKYDNSLLPNGAYGWAFNGFYPIP